MAKTVADYLLLRLREWDITRLFGYPGDGINGILAALVRAENRPAFTQSRHEEMSAFEAVGYAKFSGDVGVCLATSGPGAIHLLNGLYDAKLDHVPVVALVGQTDRSAIGGAYQQEVDLLSLFKDVTGEFVQMVTVPEQLPNVLDRAMRIAISRRCPTALIIPADVQELDYSGPTHKFKMVPSSPPTMARPSIVPDNEQLHRAADILNSGSKVAILVGQGARGAREEVIEVADLLGAGVAKALLGKDVLSDDLPFVTGAIGLLGTRPSYELMRDCDTLLTVGSSFPYSQFMPEYGQARAVQIDADPTLIGMRYPYEVNLVGDARDTLRALIPQLHRHDDRWRAGIEESVGRWWAAMEAEATIEADPINPMRLFWELNDRLPPNAIITADSGSAANWYARNLRFTTDVRGSLSGTLATMGPAVPYGIGAKFACPERPVIAFAGDGAMQMNGLAELITIARYWQEWEDPRLVVAVLHNNDLNQVTWEMRALSGSPKFPESQTIPEVPYAMFARTVGLRGIEVEKPDQIRDAWVNALEADAPTVLDVRCDPDVPPIPPHATLDQIWSTARSMLKGDQDRAGVIKQGIKTKAQEVLPRREP